MTQTAHHGVSPNRSAVETAPMTNAPSGEQPAVRPDRPVAAAKRTLHMIGNSHIDPVWLWPWQEGYQEARATFSSAVERMDEYGDFRFTCDQMVLLRWVEESDPALFEVIKRRVAEGRWVNVGGWWVEPDCNAPSGEGFARQGLLGQRYLASRFGKPATVGMNADPFGHNAMLPQILNLHGLDSYTFLRPGPHESDIPHTVFWWEAPDGSRVLAFRIPHEYCSPPGSVVGQTEKALGILDRSFAHLMVFYGVGNHGGGPTKANIDSIHRFDTMGSFGAMKLSDPERFFQEFKDALGEAGLAQLPVWRGDLQTHAAGCFSAHSGIKAWERKAQQAALAAERWGLVGSWLAESPYPRAELNRAWEQICFNQFHDIMPGSAIEPSYEDARDQLGEAVSIAKRVITWAHNQLARRIQIPFVAGTQPVVVFNPHPWPVSADVELQYGAKPAGAHAVDEAGRPVPCQPTQSSATTDDKGRGAVVFRAELPALGYRLYRLAEGAAPSGPNQNVSASLEHLENEFLRAEFDPETGWLTSLLDKRTGVDPLAGAAGEHTQLSQDPTDTWGHRVVSYAGLGAPMRLTRAVLREAGAVRGRLRMEREWGRSTLVEEFILASGSGALEVRVTIDWHEQAHLLKLRFPVALDDPVATQEIPYGFVNRPVDAAEVPGQSWADMTGKLADGRRAGLTVINNAKHGYDFSPAGQPAQGWSPSIGITALRSPVYSWHDPRTLDPDGLYAFQDQGLQHFRYLLVPHDGDWRRAGPTRGAAELGLPVRAQLESSHGGTLPPTGSFLEVNQTSGTGEVLVTAFKGAEDGDRDAVVRAVETRGELGQAVISIPQLGRSLQADFGPLQLRTFLVPADPAQPISEVDLVEWPIAKRARGAWHEVKSG
ncbi:MAG: alpha-mannosidase [Propionibacteriaceae bacterium]|jgi:alpha-mannosidase|nr:alpha-mannosidase [Propionibacteriaceae bacterium]